MRSEGPDWHGVLMALVGGNRLSVVIVGRDGDRRVFPVSDAVDVATCLRGHVDGTPLDVLCCAKSGVFTARGVLAFGVYLVGPGDVTRLMVLDLDVAGNDGSHAGGLTPDAAVAAVGGMVSILREAGLVPFVERSHGGHGWHVWVWFPEPVPAGFAKFLGEQVKNLAGLETCAAIEVFPKAATVRDGGLGSAMTLPMPGAPRAAGGGVVINSSGGCAEPADIGPSSMAAVAPLLAVYREAEAERSAVAADAALVRRFDQVRFRRVDDEPVVSLEVVARDLGDIVDDCVTEPDIVVLRCPRHGGDSLHVRVGHDAEDSWWKCHACGRGGAGDRAGALLVRWLLPGATDAAVRDALRVCSAGAP